MMKKTLVVIIVGFIITGMVITLKQSKPIDKNLLLAEKLMSDHPDSSLQVLERLNVHKFKGENKALYALLMTQAQFKNHRVVYSDSLFEVAYNFYISKDDSLRKAQVYYSRGRIFENFSNLKDAVRYYQKASITARYVNKYSFLSLVYSRWADILFKQNLFNDALIIRKKSLHYAILDNDIEMQVYAFRCIGLIYTAFNDYDKALSYYFKALRLAELINNTNRVSDICANLGYVYKCLGKYDKGISYINKSISLLSDTIFVYPRYSLKGDLFTLKQQYDSARIYIELSRRSGDLFSEASYCSLMSKLEKELDNYKTALSFSNRYINYLIKIEDKEKENSLLELQKRYDYSLIKNENDKLKISRQQMQIVVLAISLIAVIATFLFLYYFYRKRSIKRTMKLELDKMQQNLINEKSNYLKEKTIEAQRNLIKEQGLGLELSQKTEALKQHQVRERELKDYIFQMEAIVQKINTFNSMKPLQRSKSESQFTLSFQELNDLEEVVNLCYDHFADRLRAAFPKLKDDDIHLCCLLKIKVPNKNILSLLDTNELTLKKRRYRIKHDKMNLPDDFSSLEEFLLNY